jgi:hypothetical protein
VSNTNGESHQQPLTIEGLVEAVNDRGIRVHGDWFNVSQFRPVPLPEQGTMVRLEIRPNGFIKSLEVIKNVVESPTASSTARDERITKLAVLKAAASFAAQRDIKSADVLKICDLWLEWVNK